MKVYQASYYKNFNYGAYDEYEYIICANSENEALGYALQSQGNTIATNWEFEEIDIKCAEAYYISGGAYPL